ncbi:MAG: pilus assembly protein PilY [Delftia acidovorans]|jgi:type IV pilus assembly protein PilY1|nr:pilus assembly protein PilY [Delftia acidovorans]
MNRHIPFRATLLASLAAAAWAPAGSWAQRLLDLAQSPPATVEPFVAPNVILSLDDSGSMNLELNDAQTQGLSLDNPNPDGTWSTKVSRSSVLRHALRTVFNDRQLLPDGSIRLAWLTMGDCARRVRRVHNGQWIPQTPARVSARYLDSAARTGNSMRILDQEHRDNFLDYINSYFGCAWTPTHTLVSQADQYMRGALNVNGPWASVPGQRGAPYLGCRRNYHILMTDGGWNYAAHDRGNQIPETPNFDGTPRTLPDGTAYDPATTHNRIYADNDIGVDRRVAFSTVADWSFRSWALPLQATGAPNGVTGSPQPSAEYRKAPDQETFTSGSTATAASNGAKATVSLPKYWNPRNNPATWPHMVTYTLGFSKFALPHSNYTPDGKRAGALVAPPSGTLPYGYDGNFADYANGTYAWRSAGGMTRDENLPEENSPVADRGHDMWHAAINGRGQFYAVNRSEDLAAAFRQIVQQINTEVEPDRSTAAASGSTVTRSPIGLFTAHYDPNQAWKGWITAQTVAASPSDGRISQSPGWDGRSTADLLDGLSDAQVTSNRTVLTWNTARGTGVPFRWDKLDPQYQAHLGSTDGDGPSRLDYLRGVRSREGTGTPPSHGANQPFRQRQSRQGDIVNSGIWYTGHPSSLYPTQGYSAFAQSRQDRTPMIYVGGNDGMLHGFSTEDGRERLAYVPRGVAPGLYRLTEPNYDNRHRYFVDGSPMTGDVLDGNQWKTLLVGTLGAGGKGYFVLDATDPGNFHENNASSLVLMDRSLHAQEELPAHCGALPDAQARQRCEADKDLGHIFAQPVLDDSNPQRTTQITQLNNGRWAVVMGNGYNSHSGRAVLVVQYLDGQREMLRLPAPGGDANGLSAPRLVDINGDGRPDVVYAGDLQGNLWKFLIASDDVSKWGVAFDGQPLFTASDPTAAFEKHSITAAPTVRAHDRRQVMKNSAGQDENLPVGGMMVAFGTGRNLTPWDPDMSPGASIYSVLDNTRYKRVDGPDGPLVEPCLSTADADCKLLRADQVPATVTREQLVQLAQASKPVSGAGASTGRNFWQINGGGVDWTLHKGWYLPLPAQGERLLKTMSFFDGSNILAIYSQIPARSRMDIDGVTGGRTVETCDPGSLEGEKQFLTLLNIMDGKRPSVQVLDSNGDGVYNAADGGVHRMAISKGAQTQIVQGDRILVRGDNGEQHMLARMPEQPMRPSWRQLQ